ncbi:MAG: methionyl-tRNA formyltransferase [Candidatus Udaeobacter sp.]
MASGRMRIVFIGTGEIGIPTLEALLKSEHDVIGLVTQPNKPAGREQRIEPPPIKKAVTSGAPNASPARTGRALPFPILQPVRIKDQHAIEDIGVLKPDVIVVRAYGQILPRDVLEIPKIACLNLHASLLPRWRGAAPIQAAIAGGDPETGITVMHMDEGLDTGDILLQRRIDIRSNDTGGSLHERLAQIAPEALLESLRLLATNAALHIPQDNSLATYAPKLTREDGRIDWSEPAQTIERRIRAYNPWPGAFMELAPLLLDSTAAGGRNLKIFSASVVDLSGEAGEILPGEDGLVIAASKGALSLGEVQLEGKRRMTASEFLRGHAAMLRASR